MKQYKILIADDESPVRRILERICKSLDWLSDSAEDGNKALELMKQNDYDIFTVDVNMPGPSGIDLSRKILELYDSPAILILTGYAEVKQAVEATKEGVYNYIQKDDVEIDDIKEHLIKAANYHENLLRSNQARKQREKEVINTEIASKQFQAVFDLSSDITLIADVKNLQITDCNPAACERLDYTRSELLQMCLSNFGEALSSDNIQKQLETSKIGKVEESTVKNKNGDVIPVDISYTHVCLPHGEYVSVMMRDITERKEMQAQILHERNLLHLLMDNIPDNIYFKDKDLKYTCINKAYIRKLNLSLPEQALNKTDIELLPKADAVNTQNEEQMLLDNKQPLINLVKESLFPDGSKKWYSITKVPIVNPEKKVSGLIGIERDISSIKYAEQKIKKTTQELEVKVVELDNIINSLPVGVILTNELGTITQVNQWLETFLNVPAEYLLNSEVERLFQEYLQLNVVDQVNELKKYGDSDWLDINIDFKETKHEISMKALSQEEIFMGIVVFIKTTLVETPIKVGDKEDNTLNPILPETLENIITPLNGMVDMAAQLSESQLNSDQKLLAETILQCGRSIQSLVQVLPDNHSSDR